MKMRFSAAVLSVFLTAGAAYAGHMEGDHEKWEEKKEARMEEIHKELGLTPEQEAKLKEHRKAHREQAKSLGEEVRQRHEALRQELEKPDMDESRVRALQGEMKDAQSRMADHRLEGILAVRKVLTPEQFKKFQQLTYERGEKGKHPRKGHPKKHPQEMPH